MTQQEVMQRFMKSLDTTTKSGEAALDEAIDYATKNSNRHFSTIAQALAAMKDDIATTNDAEKFLLEKCGIDLSNTDVGAITGLDAGGSKVKTAESIVPESGSLLNFTGNSFYVSKYDITFYLSNIDANGPWKFEFQRLDR